MKKKLLITCIPVLMIALGILLLNLSPEPSDEAGFLRIVEEQPSTYEELQLLVREHIFAYEEADKGRYLGSPTPLPPNDDQTRKEQPWQVICYPGASPRQFTSACKVFTFQKAWPHQQHEHYIYFNAKGKIIGYGSDWMDQADYREVAQPSRL